MEFSRLDLPTLRRPKKPMCSRNPFEVARIMVSAFSFLQRVGKCVDYIGSNRAGAKALSVFRPLSARLKSCPDTKRAF
jgi:hypothetical protein